RVTNRAFTTAVLAALALFIPVRFSWLPMTGLLGIAIDIIAVIGVGVVLGLMSFGFFGLRVARTVAVIATLAVAPFAIGTLHEYATLTASLVAYAVSTVVCWAMSVGSNASFDFALIKQRTGDFD